MRAGIGFSNQSDAFENGRHVISEATSSTNIENPEFILAFCTKDLDHEHFLRGMQDVVGHSVPIVGGTTIGIISNHNISYKAPSSGALVLQLDNIKVRVARADGIDEDEVKSGVKLAETLGSSSRDKLMFILYDMVKSPAAPNKPPQMNSLLSLLRGIQSIYPTHIPVFGGGTIGDYSFSHSKLFCEQKVCEQALLSVVFSGDFIPYHTIMHGCTPFDGAYHKITKNRGTTILEFDGRPAISILDSIFKNPNWQNEVPVKDLTIGINLGEKYGAFKESNYVTRLISGTVAENGGIMTPEPDWHEGTEVQFLIRDNEEMIESAKENSTTLFEQISADGKTPRLALYIDCAGRTSYFCNSIQEEASMVQKICNNRNVPLFGFYSGIEVAPFLGVSRGLEWTGVLIVFAD